MKEKCFKKIEVVYSEMYVLEFHFNKIAGLGQHLSFFYRGSQQWCFPLVVLLIKVQKQPIENITIGCFLKRIVYLEMNWNFFLIKIEGLG